MCAAALIRLNYGRLPAERSRYSSKTNVSFCSAGAAASSLEETIVGMYRSYSWKRARDDQSTASRVSDTRNHVSAPTRDKHAPAITRLIIIQREIDRQYFHARRDAVEDTHTLSLFLFFFQDPSPWTATISRKRTPTFRASESADFIRMNTRPI